MSVENSSEEQVRQMTSAYSDKEQECVETLLAGIPEEGGSVSREIIEKLIRASFRGGVLAVARGGR
jgi:hypothetical protein